MTIYKDYDDFLPFVTSDVPGCPRPVAIEYVRKFAIRLCEKAQVLRLDASEINIQEDQVKYSLNFTENLFKAISIHNAVYSESNTQMSRTQEHLLDDAYPTWRTQVTSSRPLKYFLSLDNKFHVYLKPTANVDDDPIIATCVVKPVRSALKIPIEIYENYVETIAYGALSELQLMQQQSWFDEKLAAGNSRKWRSGVRNARANAVRGYDGDASSGANPQDFLVMA